MKPDEFELPEIESHEVSPSDWLCVGSDGCLGVDLDLD